jgi:hypothetical protein
MRNFLFVMIAAGLLASCAHSGQKVAETERLDCLQETGSRIKPAAGKCNNNPGRVVTREEIERSGAFNSVDALRKTVPQVH